MDSEFLSKMIDWLHTQRMQWQDNSARLIWFQNLLRVPSNNLIMIVDLEVHVHVFSSAGLSKKMVYVLCYQGHMNSL